MDSKLVRVVCLSYKRRKFIFQIVPGLPLTTFTAISRYVLILSDADYRAACISKFGRVLNHKLERGSQMEVRRRFTKPLWCQIYPKDPFELPDDKEFVLKLYKNVDQKLSITSGDVIEEALRQRAFYYQGALKIFEVGLTALANLFRPTSIMRQ